jgi:hypothetical protein
LNHAELDKEASQDSLVHHRDDFPSAEPLPAIQPTSWLFAYPARVRFPNSDEAGKLLCCPTIWYVLHLYQVPCSKALFEPGLAPFVQDRQDGIIEYLEDGQWKELIY